MYILGIHDGHCSSACLLSNKKIIAWVQEERFTRKKNEIDFPVHSINYCLKKATPFMVWFAVPAPTTGVELTI